MRSNAKREKPKIRAGRKRTNTRSKKRDAEVTLPSPNCSHSDQPLDSEKKDEEQERQEKRQRQRQFDMLTRFVMMHIKRCNARANSRIVARARNETPQHDLQRLIVKTLGQVLYIAALDSLFSLDLYQRLKKYKHPHT